MSIKVKTADLGYEYSSCFINVHKQVKAEGGRAQFGWLAGLVLYDAIQTWNHHCVWRNPDGELIDITPQITHFGEVLFPVHVDFIPDDKATLLPKKPGLLVSRLPRYTPLQKSKNINKAMNLIKKADAALQQKNFALENFYCEQASQLLDGWIVPFGPAGVFKPFKI